MDTSDDFYANIEADDLNGYEIDNNEQCFIAKELIVEITKIMDNMTFKRFGATCKYIKYICECDYLSTIVNKNVPEVLLSFDLEQLCHFSGINRRINNLVRTNEFWYLKLEHDYPKYILHIAIYQSYIGRVVHQDIIQNSKKYYLFYKHFDNLPKDTENTIELFVKFISLVGGWRFMPISMLLILLSITYNDTGLDKRIAVLGIEKLSVSTLISSILPADYNNVHVMNGIYISNKYSYGTAKNFTILPPIDVNLHGLIEMYYYLTKPDASITADLY